MNLTRDYKIVTAVDIKDYSNFDYDKWEEEGGERPSYLSIGHGDVDEEYGYELQFIVWAIIDSQLRTSNLIDPLKEGDNFGGGPTHGSLWGHHVTDRDYKGRYEPETGRLSVVKPERYQHREIPDVIMKQLESKFKNIKEIQLF